jgi:hypothetical protein
MNFILPKKGKKENKKKKEESFCTQSPKVFGATRMQLGGCVGLTLWAQSSDPSIGWLGWPMDILGLLSRS